MPFRYLYWLSAGHRDPRADRHLGYILAFIAGAVNAGGFLAIGQYTSHMSGIVSSMADNAVLGNFVLMFSALVAWLSFVSGAATTAILVNLAKRHCLQSQYALCLLLESGLLLLFGIAGANLSNMREFLTPVTVLLLCFIMGLQNAIITKASGTLIRTTHVTGLSTDFGIELGKLLYWNRRDLPHLAVIADRDKMKVHGRLILYFVTGGVAGALGFKYLGYSSTIILSAILALLAALPIYIDLQVRRKTNK